MDLETEITKRWLTENPFVPPTLPNGWERKFGREGIFKKFELDQITKENLKKQYQPGDEFWRWVGRGASLMLIRNNCIIDEYFYCYI